MATTSSPLYGIGDVVYFRESAALGFLEAVRISGATLRFGGWLYTINANMRPPTAGSFHDRRSLVSTEVMYYSESELVVLCEAMILAEANAKRAYDRIKAQRQLHCPDSPTESD